MCSEASSNLIWLYFQENYALYFLATPCIGTIPAQTYVTQTQVAAGLTAVFDAAAVALCSSVLSVRALSMSSSYAAALSVANLFFHNVGKWTCGMNACKKCQLRKS